MGKEKYMRKIEELFKKSPIVSFNSINMIINNKGYTKQLIRNLVLKGKIKKLTKGYYTLYEDPSLLVLCLQPAYLGLQDALSFHNLWEQETIPVIITTRKIRQGIRKVIGTNVLIRRLDKKYFFGLDYYKVGDFCLPYSDVEKTILDMVYFKENINKKIIKNVKKDKLILYLKHYPRKLSDNMKQKIF